MLNQRPCTIANLTKTVTRIAIVGLSIAMVQAVGGLVLSIC